MYIRHGGCGNFVASVSLFRFLFFLYVDTLLAQPWLLLLGLERLLDGAFLTLESWP